MKKLSDILKKMVPLMFGKELAIKILEETAERERHNLSVREFIILAGLIEKIKRG